MGFIHKIDLSSANLKSGRASNPDYVYSKHVFHYDININGGIGSDPAVAWSQTYTPPHKGFYRTTILADITSGNRLYLELDSGSIDGFITYRGMSIVSGLHVYRTHPLAWAAICTKHGETIVAHLTVTVESIYADVVVT